MNHYEPGGISYPRRRDDWMRDHPLASRLLIMIVGFAVLVPIDWLIEAQPGQRREVRRASPGPPWPLTRSSSSPRLVVGPPRGAPAAPRPSVAGASGAPAPTSVESATAPTAPPAPVGASSAPATVAADEGGAVHEGHESRTDHGRRPGPRGEEAGHHRPAPKATSPPTTRRAPTTKDGGLPTTTTEAVAAPPVNTYSKAEVEAIIRRCSRQRRPTRRSGSPPGSQPGAHGAELVLLRLVPDLLPNEQEDAGRHRRHVGRAAVRPDDQRPGGLRHLPAVRLGPLARGCVRLHAGGSAP